MLVPSAFLLRPPFACNILCNFLQVCPSLIFLHPLPYPAALATTNTIPRAFSPLALSYVLLSSIECLAPPSTPAVSTWATAADVGYVWSGQPVDLFLAKRRHIRLIQIFTRLLIISLGLAIAASSSPFKCVVRTHPSSH